MDLIVTEFFIVVLELMSTKGMRGFNLGSIEDKTLAQITVVIYILSSVFICASNPPPNHQTAFFSQTPITTRLALYSVAGNLFLNTSTMVSTYLVRMQPP